MSITLMTPWLTSSVYLAPISDKGIVTAWLNKHPAWHYGFIVRIFWLGFVLRWIKRRYIYAEDYIPFLDEESQ